MTFYTICLFLIPLLIGALIVHLAWKNTEAGTLSLKVSLGIGTGLGLASLLYFIFLLLFAGQNGFFPLMLFVLISLMFLSFRKRFREKAVFKGQRLTWIQYILVCILGGSGILSMFTLINMTLSHPHGGFDAWLIWNRAARFIYRGAEDWKNAFSSDFFFFFQPDYPLLLPVTNAWIWNTLGVETLRAPFIQAALYLLGSGVLLFSALRLTASLGQACLATIMLLGTKTYIAVGAAQIADVPLAFFILMTTVLLHLYSKTSKNGLLMLAGFSAGLCGWTKNEGNAFILITTLALVIMLWGNSGKKGPFLSYLVGILFPLLAILYFKTYLAPPSDLIEGGVQDLEQVTDLSRYLLIGGAILSEVKSFAGWPYLIPVLIVYYWLMRAQDMQDLTWRRVTGLMISLQVMSYLFVYLITPYPLEFHLAHSFDRILLHVYPSFLYLLFNSTITPELLFQPSKFEPEGLQSGKQTYASHH